MEKLRGFGLRTPNSFTRSWENNAQSVCLQNGVQKFQRLSSGQSFTSLMAKADDAKANSSRIF
ncbi:MAG: hypothetical protein M0R33_08015 [Methylomonas sp.]|jgi:hypothetical protein|uniref:hypothetical protein n=1 Tax=Methylomonas sp. TaxID=418 RepID=UPI0025D70DAF|nr:hypothetical protein [Methylomonas sp.]MCK9606383.1 hypothetical protein [Methylomonas sp.]